MKRFETQLRIFNKKAIPVFLMLLVVTNTKAQQNIDSLEFGIDNIADFGQAVHKISIAPAPVVTSFPFNVDISSSSDGLHTLYVRTHSTTTSGPALGYWSETNYTYFYKQNNIPASVSNIQKLEYFIDTDPGEGNAITINVAPAVQVSGISFNPNIGPLSNGFHVLFIRSLDQDGKWSITNYVYFFKQNNIPPVVSTITRMEYFIDTDPGAGNGNAISFSPATNISGLSFNANISALAAGFHVIFIRSLDANGKWSITNYAYFSKAEPQTATPVNIVKIEYFIDTDPGYFSAVDVPVTPAPDIANKNFIADITGLPVGTHYLNSRSLDSRGNWSVNAIAPFNINSTLPLQLLYFSAAPDDHAVNITWQTSFEQNLRSFNVEYSNNGTLFSMIGTVAPLNNTSGSSYSFRHLTPVTGKNFYRLKIIEADGSFHYSDSKLVNFSDQQSPVQLYPNPADEYFMVKTSWKNFSLDIITADGKLVKKLTVLQAGTPVEVGSLPSGLYSIRISNEQTIVNSLLIIKH